METTVRYGYAASIGNLVYCLVWTLTKGVNDRMGAGDAGHLTASK